MNESRQHNIDGDKKYVEVGIDEWFEVDSKKRDPKGRYYRYKSPSVGGECRLVGGSPGLGKRN